MSRYVALLRGINVGGHHKLPMKDLCAIFSEAGCVQVRHYIQSGNIVFSCKKAAVRVCERVSAEIEKRFGFAPPIVLRTEEEMYGVLKENPYLKAGAPEDQLHVVFLSHAPTPAQIAKVELHSFPPEDFTIRGRHMYMWLPNGMGNAKLARVPFDQKLQTVGTARNWRTVTKLVEMLREKD